jgi:hypothetical protein
VPIKLSLQENNVIVADCVDSVSVDDLKTAMQGFISYFEKSSDRVNVIIDWTLVTNYPNMAAAKDLMIGMLRHVNAGYVGMIGLNAFLGYWMDFFNKMIGQRYLKFNDLDEAKAFFMKLQLMQETAAD